MNGSLVGLVAKQHLAGEGIHYEPRWFKRWPDNAREYAEIGGQSVPIGDLLFEIDDRPYRYALERAKSDQQMLEGQILDTRRVIASQQNGISVSQANTHSAQADLGRYAAAVDEARADVANSEQGVARAKAQWAYANNNLHRVEPLLAKQFVTADQVDLARTQEEHSVLGETLEPPPLRIPRLLPGEKVSQQQP